MMRSPFVGSLIECSINSKRTLAHRASIFDRIEACMVQRIVSV
jgi:hypothetical protein